jgi:hypothetical protein
MKHRTLILCLVAAFGAAYGQSPTLPAQRSSGVTVDGSGALVAPSNFWQANMAAFAAAYAQENEAHDPIVKTSGLWDTANSEIVLQLNDDSVIMPTRFAPSFREALGLGGAALLDVGTTTGTIAAGDDARIVAGGTAMQLNALPAVAQSLLGATTHDQQQDAIGMSSAGKMLATAVAEFPIEKILVAGSTNESVNGDYLPNGEIEGKPAYLKVDGRPDGEVIIWSPHSGGFWSIVNDYYSIHNSFEDVPTPDLAITWTGVSAPTVTAVRKAPTAAGLELISTITDAGDFATALQGQLGQWAASQFTYPAFVFEVPYGAPWTDFELKASHTNFGVGGAPDMVFYYHSAGATGTEIGQHPDVWFTDSGTDPREWRPLAKSPRTSIAASLTDANSALGGIVVVVTDPAFASAVDNPSLVWSWAWMDGTGREEDSAGRPIWRPTIPRWVPTTFSP